MPRGLGFHLGVYGVTSNTNLERIIYEGPKCVLCRCVGCSRIGRRLPKQPWACRKKIFRRAQGVHACIILTYIMPARFRI